MYEFAFYTRKTGPDMMRIRFEELKDDIYDHYGVSFSSDHGRTWSQTQHWEMGRTAPGGMLRRGFLPGLVEPKSGRLLMTGCEGVLRNDQALDGMTQYYPIYRVSEDGGTTWKVEERIVHKGEEYTHDHPFEGVWVGKNSLMICNAEIATADGRILAPSQITPLGPDGKYFCPPGAYTFTEAAVLIGTWQTEGRLDWELSQRVKLSPEQSLRGAIEPTLAEMPDGRILMVLRANDGHKWSSISRDGGYTWDAPRHWTYTDGSPFYSPSSIARLFKHSNGTYYWFGNICPEMPDGNLPRYPLVVGRVDGETLLLDRQSLFTIDTRKESDSPSLQLSNFGVHGDRLTGDLMLRMTRWDRPVSSGGPDPVKGSVYLYRVEP